MEANTIIAAGAGLEVAIAAFLAIIFSRPILRIEGHVNGDGKADFRIELKNPQIAALDGGDFFL